MRGFTVIEILVVLSVVVFVTAISLPVFRIYQNKSSLESASQLILNDLRNAQRKAQTSQNDDVWGVNIAQNKITVFKGGDFMNRNPQYDEEENIPKNISITGISQFIFEKISGEPDAAGTTTLSNVYNSKSIYINEKGAILY